MKKKYIIKEYVIIDIIAPKIVLYFLSPLIEKEGILP